MDGRARVSEVMDDMDSSLYQSLESLYHSLTNDVGDDCGYHVSYPDAPPNSTSSSPTSITVTWDPIAMSGANRHPSADTVAPQFTPISTHRPSKTKRERVNWSKETDEALLDAVNRYGLKWRRIAHELGLGSDDAVRNRILRMDPLVFPAEVRHKLELMKASTKRQPANFLEHKPYTEEEDRVIVDELKRIQHRKCSMSWKALSEGPLCRRTAHSIRNRAYRLIAKQERMAKVVATRCESHVHQTPTVNRTMDVASDNMSITTAA